MLSGINSAYLGIAAAFRKEIVWERVESKRLQVFAEGFRNSQVPSLSSGFSKPRFWGTYVLHPGFSWFSSFL